MVTRTESSEPVRQQLAGQGVSRGHSLQPGLYPLPGSEGAARAPAGLPWSQGCPDPLHPCCILLALLLGTTGQVLYMGIQPLAPLGFFPCRG